MSPRTSTPKTAAPAKTAAKKTAAKKTAAKKPATAKKPAAKAASAKPAAKKTAAAKKPVAKKAPAAKKPAKAAAAKPAAKKAAPAKPRQPRLPPVLGAIVKAVEDKKGGEVSILDVRGLSGVADYLVLCTGMNLPHLAALADNVVGALRKLDPPVAPHRRAGARETEWVVLDYIDVVVHFFTPAMRSYYALEQLWKDAPRLLPAP